MIARGSLEILKFEITSLACTAPGQRSHWIKQAKPLYPHAIRPKYFILVRTGKTGSSRSKLVVEIVLGREQIVYFWAQIYPDLSHALVKRVWKLIAPRSKSCKMPLKDIHKQTPKLRSVVVYVSWVDPEKVYYSLWPLRKAREALFQSIRGREDLTALTVEIFLVFKSKKKYWLSGPCKPNGKPWNNVHSRDVLEISFQLILVIWAL